MNSSRVFAALACAALTALSACDYEKTAVQDIAGPEPGARILFFNFGLNAPGVNFYANDRKMTAISAVTCVVLPPTNPNCLTTGVESTTGTAFGAVAANGFYTGIEPGQYTLSGKIAAATDKDLAISGVQATLETGKAYSYYLSGLYNTTTKKSDAFVVEDPIPATIDFTKATVRFVNAIHNSSPMVLYAKETTTGTEFAIGSAVAYKAAGAFTPIPGAIYDLSTRAPGSSTNIITRAGVTFENRKVYTITARGDITVTGSTATNRPFLDNTANR